jgi:hypothetical protein
MLNLLIILQIFTFEVNAIQWGDSYYARISPAKAFGNEIILEGVMMVLIDSTLVGTQHEQYYGCRVPYYRLRCDIVHKGVAYYMDRVDYVNDKSTMENLTE